MKTSKIIYRTIFGLIVAQTLGLFAAQSIFCQTETLDIVTYTPPKGWTKTVKEGAVVVDVGINRTAEGKLVGDVDFEAVVSSKLNKLQ